MHLTGQMPKSVLDGFSGHGRWVGSPEAQDLARLANENPPVLRTLDARGDRLDLVEYHPAYHALMRRGVSIGLNASIWSDQADEIGLRNEARAVRFMLTNELECGHTCPLTMTHASVAALMTEPDILKDWMPRITSREYDSSQKSPGSKKGLTIGMGMTERQGGSDVRANTSQAAKGNDGRWRITGEKWFFSAPMCDAFLILAQTQMGLSCFLVPRLLPDGKNNGLHLQRLKDKVGNRSNASSEVKFDTRVGLSGGRRGKGGADDIGNGDADAAGLCGRFSGADACSPVGSRIPLPPSRCFWQETDRSTADDSRFWLISLWKWRLLRR